MYAKGRMHIQCDSHVQIDAKDSVGIVAREGDVDLVVEKGNVNADVAGNIDADVKKNLNVHVVNNANVFVEGNMKATVTGTSDLKLDGEVKVTSQADISLKGQAIKIEGTSIDMTAPTVKISDDLDIGANTTIGGQCDIRSRTKIANQLFVDNGISCGGFLRNRGIADLGSPVIAHGLQVVPGTGSGSGRGANTPDSPDSPSEAQKSQRDDGVEVVKSFANLSNGDPSPIQRNQLNPGSARQGSNPSGTTEL
jgi:hypothetical protein